MSIVQTINLVDSLCSHLWVDLRLDEHLLLLLHPLLVGPAEGRLLGTVARVRGIAGHL